MKVGPGPVHLNVANIKNSYERQKIASHITGNGSGLVTLNLTELESQGGDPKVLLGPRFDASAGPDLWREQEALLEDLFGAARETTEGVEFDSIAEAVEAARESAQQLLASNQWDAEGTRLKLAVRLEESREVVWIEVESWNDHKGVGILMSDPKAAGVSSGSQLPFSIDMIMDFQLMQGVDIVAKGGVDALVKAMQG